MPPVGVFRRWSASAAQFAAASFACPSAIHRAESDAGHTGARCGFTVPPPAYHHPTAPVVYHETVCRYA